MTEVAATEALRAAGGANWAQTASAQQTVDPQAVQAFDRAMATNGAKPVENIPFVTQIAETWRAAEVRMQSHAHRMKALADLSMQRPLSAGELSELQYQFATAGFHLEVTTIVAKKVSDAVSTLVKNG